MDKYDVIIVSMVIYVLFWPLFFAMFCIAVSSVFKG